MGAIQSAINEGITSAAILGQLNEVPQARREEKTANKLLDMTFKQYDVAEKAVKQASEKMAKTNKPLSDEELKDVDSYTAPYNELQKLSQEAAKKVALRKGDADMYNIATWLQPISKLYDPQRKEQANAMAQEQMQQAKSIKPRNFYKELREMELNDEQQ